MPRRRRPPKAAELGHTTFVVRNKLNGLLAVLLAVFTLQEINYPLLRPQSALAVFALIGLVLCFQMIPTRKAWSDRRWARLVDDGLTVVAAACCAYVVAQTEPAFETLWLDGRPLGERAGAETATDLWVGAIGLLIVLEAARRSVGLALPILAAIFLAYAYFGPSMPSWLLPHRGYSAERIVAQAFLHGQGVFGTALKVMFSYVYPFVLFGAALDATGATRRVVDYAKRLFSGSAGGPAKVAVISSGLMGSLSGSAVANTATTGTFTIPLMRSAGFPPHMAGGIAAAASSGGALVPPVMGAGAYMMLEIVVPPVTYLEIVRAAIIPAIIYYASLLLIVHFQGRRIGAAATLKAPGALEPGTGYSGVLFAAALASLIGLLVAGYSVFRAATLALGVVVVMSLFNSHTRMTWARAFGATRQAAAGAVTLIAATACVGIVIGIVTLTGVGTRFPAMVLPLAQDNLFLALVLIMGAAIVLGMGVPSAVCYLLLATLMGPALGQLGVVPLAAHLFIFYFGMMSMVTPPVALAAYTAASIAGASILRTSLAAFRFSLIGFALPYLFVYRPELLLLSAPGESPRITQTAIALGIAALGTLGLAAAIAGFWARLLSPMQRGLLTIAALLLLYPARGEAAFGLGATDVVGAILMTAVWFWSRASGTSEPTVTA